MSKTVHITSSQQFSSLIASSTIVVADFYADWCGPCKTIAPIYEQLSASLSRPNKITFVKIDVDRQQEIAGAYGITAMPTFLVFKNAEVVSTVRGADPKGLSEAVQKLAAEAENLSSNSSSSAGGFTTGSGTASGSSWLGCSLPRGFSDVTDQVELKGLDLLNSDSDFGTARALFEPSKPSGGSRSAKGKGKADDAGQPDWVESDTDEQLMLFVPFKATLKVHTLQITSLPPTSDDDAEEDTDEIPMRPKTIQVYSNRAHVLGFEEAEDIPATQTVVLSRNDWDPKTGTAKIELRFVKFQNVTSLVIFVVDGDGDGERVRVDRLRIIGETGEKRELGKLEKIGDEAGE